MISVIMPSLFIPSGIVDRIKEIVSHPLIGEFILIDNTNKDDNIKEEIPKLIHIKEGKNTYVNPAWNKGASLAKYEKLLFLNDDTITDFAELIDRMYDEVTEDRGIIGLGEGCWDYKEGEFSIEPISTLTTGFGCIFFIHKNSFIEIPDELKIWYGDNWLLEKNKKRAFKIRNWKVWGKISESYTSSTNLLTTEDTKRWSNVFSKHEKR